jgi:hypothetical protein
MRRHITRLLLTVFSVFSASILHGEIMVLDCGDETQGRKIAYLISPPHVQLIGQDEPSGVIVQRTITSEGRIVNSYLHSGSNQVVSVVSITPKSDELNEYKVQRAVTSTGEFTEFNCSRDKDVELLLSQSIAAILEDLSDFQKPLDVLLYSAMDLKGISIERSDASLASLLRTPEPLTDEDRRRVARQISSCWVVDNRADWSKVSVTVRVNLDSDGKVRGDVELIDYSGGDDVTARGAFEAARRAILRCQSSGYNLPVESHEEWESSTIAFDANTMRVQFQ